MATINGTNRNNRLNGTPGNDEIWGYDGDDILYGFAGNDRLWGGYGNDALLGGDGNDALFGGSGDDVLSGGNGNDTLAGGFGSDTLSGGDGDDTLSGLVTEYTDDYDTMSGGAGNDTYEVGLGNLLLGLADVVIEQANAGYDTVRTSLAQYTLPVNVERLTYTGNNHFVGYGNELNNRIDGSDYDGPMHYGYDDYLFGRAGNDALYGNGGDDWLEGGSGNDTLFGGAGGDVLDGGSGNDIMSGGADWDLYYVDSAGDTVTESWGGGVDEVRTSLLNYTLPSNVEELAFWGESLIGVDFTGNMLGNSITGSSQNDVIRGLGGDDALFGEDGNDTLYGGAGNDGLIGGSGDDALYGGNGADILFGGAGYDRYVYTTPGDSTNSLTDEITQFLSGYNKLDLSAIDADATRLGNQTFTLSAGPAAFSVWQYQDEMIDRVVVAADVDGNSVADLVIHIRDVGWGGLMLAESDFIL